MKKPPVKVQNAVGGGPQGRSPRGRKEIVGAARAPKSSQVRPEVGDVKLPNVWPKETPSWI